MHKRKLDNPKAATLFASGYAESGNTFCYDDDGHGHGHFIHTKYLAEQGYLVSVLSKFDVLSHIISPFHHPA